MAEPSLNTADRPHRAAKRYIYAWGGGRAEGDASMRDLLGGKGAGLAEMTNAGVPVPPGFTITTDVCRWFYAHGRQLPPEFEGASPADRYAAAIAFMDSQIARLVQALDEKRALDRTAIIVTADHGESLGDHGERGHGIFVYESALRVPLIVRWPGIAPRRVPDLVQLIDLAPTILALEGLEAPPMDGANLAPVLRGRPAGGRTGYAESMFPLQHGWSALRTVRDNRFKLIEAPRPELYDLATDPDELQNLYDTQPAAAARLAAKLRTFGPAELHPAAVPAEPGNDQRDQLAALGYVSPSRGPAPAAPPAIWPDPKDMIGVYNDIVEQRMRLRGR